MTSPPPISVLPRPLVCRWDLDKTYLRTEFGTLRDLVRIPFERAEDKVNVPGVTGVIRGLKAFGAEQRRPVHIHFISASPPQIGATIREKLRLDEVEYDDITFKDQLQNIVRGKFRNLREQVGYKLTALLDSRTRMDPESREILFGDDWESDPLIYSIYADVLCGHLSAPALRSLLQSIAVDPELIERALSLYPRHPDGVVTRIYINLERRTPLAFFTAFGTRLVPAFNYLQSAACLYQDGHLGLAAVVAVAQSLIDSWGYTPERLANSLADIERRGHLGQAAAGAIRDHLRKLTLLPVAPEASAAHPSSWQRLHHWLRRRWQVRQKTAPLVAPASEFHIDYPTLVARWRALREGAHA